MSQTTVPSHSEGESKLFKRSCVRCNLRKVRCDRQYPCGRCLQTGAECIHPEKRATRKLNRPPIAAIRGRLQQLEKEVERRTGTPLSTDNNDGSHLRNQSNCAADKRVHGERTSLRGRLVVRDESKSRYVGDEASVVLGDKIRELQELYDQSLDEEITRYSYNNHIGHPLVSLGTLWSNYGFSAGEGSIEYRPPLQMEMLWDIYKANVAPLIALLHLPSIELLVCKACLQPDAELDPESEALIRAVFFAAVVSMKPQQCLLVVGKEHDICLHEYRLSVEQSLARANLVNTLDVRVLQAAVLFLLCLRCLSDSRLVWAETAVVVRVAQRLGIHRDGQRLNLSPFDIEMRRRLWCHICILDVLCSEDQGTDAQIRPEMFDTMLPSNIDIGDLAPEQTDMPSLQAGFTDITLCIIQCEIISNLSWNSQSLGSGSHGLSTVKGETSLSRLANSIEERFLQKLDLNSPIQWVTAVIARLTLSKASLVNHLSKTESDKSPTYADDKAFNMVIEILKFTHLLHNNASTSQWTWLCKSYKQQHVVALALSELGSRPISPETNQVWDLVMRVYDEYLRESQQTNTLLQEPLSRLVESAAISRKQRSEALGG